MKTKPIMTLVMSVFVIGTVATGWAAYPERPIDLVVGYELGALSDLQCRVMMSVAWEDAYLGTRVNIVTRRSGMHGRTGWDWCRPPERCRDGYALMAYKLPHCLARAIAFRTGDDADTYEPVANWSREPVALIVPRDSPFKTLADLLAFCAEHPGKLTVSGAGLYVGHHVAFLQLEDATGHRMAYIPEKSGMAALHSVAQSVVMAGFNDLSTALRNQGQVRVLAVADTARSPEASDIPTLQEQGVAVDDLSVCFRGVAFPRGVSREALAVLTEKLPAMFRDPRLGEALESLRSPLHILAGPQIRILFRDRQQRLEKLLRDRM